MIGRSMYTLLEEGFIDRSAALEALVPHKVFPGNRPSVTILYDNTSYTEGTEADWGFACLIEAHGRTLLFDTGAKGQLLLSNMAQLGIDPARIEQVVISHSHWDHTGGLDALLTRNPCPVLLPLRRNRPSVTARCRRRELRSERESGMGSTRSS